VTPSTPTKTERSWTRNRRAAAISVMVLVLHGGAVRPAAGQQSVTDVLSFLLTNRSINTADFQQDEQAAAATRDAISARLLIELATLPISSSTSGFTYRLNPTLGTLERSSDSFGPFFIERSLTAGQGRVSFGLGYQEAAFDSIDGRNLRDGTLIAIASTIHGAPEPFDVETLTLRIHTRTATLSTNWGLTDRLDVGAVLPFVMLTLSGERTDTYRGTPFPQASASVSAAGVGDLLLRAKYNLFRSGGTGLAIGGESRLPTGNEQNLLGTGRTTVKPLLIGSLDGDRVALHGDVGYSFGGLSREVDYGAAVTAVGARHLTLVGEVNGRWIASLGRLTDVTEPRPGLVDVDTIRLSSVPEGSQQIVAVAGFKWNVAATWLLSASVIRPITKTGLNAPWTPTLTLDRAF
jgi:hypothetical protein